MDLKLLLLFIVASFISGGWSYPEEDPTKGLKLLGEVKISSTLSKEGVEEKVQKFIKTITDAIAGNDNTVVVLKSRSKKVHIKLKGTEMRNRELKERFSKAKIIGTAVLDPAISRNRNSRNIQNLLEQTDLKTAKTVIIIEN